MHYRPKKTSLLQDRPNHKQVVNRFWLPTLILCFLTLFNSISAYAKQTTCELKSRHGYLLIMLYKTNVNAQIEYTFYKNRKISSLAKKYTISQDDIDKGYVLFAQPQGQYQILSLNSPLYNLPYRVDTRANESWRYSIEKDKVNYIGELHMAKKRTKNAIDTYLVNRSVKNHPSINKKLAHILSNCSLVNGRNIRDDFWKELN